MSPLQTFPDVPDETRRQRRREWKKEYEMRRRNLHIPECIQWGLYSLDIPNFDDNAGIIELKRFIHELDDGAKWAKPREEVITDLMRPLCKVRSPLDIITSIPSIFETADGDFFLLNDSRTLNEHLGKRFEKPLLHRASLSGNSLSGRQLSLAAVWTHLNEQPDKMIDVYDYSMIDPASRTRRMTVRDVLSHWRIPAHKRHAINLLDIENRIGDFCPTEIIEHDLYCKLSRVLPDNVGKTNSQWTSSRQEFFLLSGANAISSIHVDNGAQLTWILVLEGRKIWYFPRQVTDDAIRLLALTGSQWSQGYEGGWVRVELCPGDLLVMPPSCPHAVFTPDDCLAVGGHFYTAAHLSSTLRGLRLQEDYSDICNEDLQAAFYNVLQSVFENIDYFCTPIQQASILTSSSLFLDSLDAASLSMLIQKNGRGNRSHSVNDQQSRVLKRLESRPINHSHLSSNRTRFLNAIEDFHERRLETWEAE